MSSARFDANLWRVVDRADGLRWATSALARAIESRDWHGIVEGRHLHDVYAVRAVQALAEWCAA